MKNVLILLLAVALTAALTYIVVSHRLAGEHAARLVQERARWESEKAALEEALRQAEASALLARRAASSVPQTRPTNSSVAPRTMARTISPAPASSDRTPSAPLVAGSMENPVALLPPATPAPAPIAPNARLRYMATLPGKGSKCRIDGTSSIHDWSMESPILVGHFEVPSAISFDTRQATLAGLTDGRVSAKASVRIPVRSLKSYSLKMDEVYKQHMDESVYRDIEYRLRDLVLSQASHLPNTPFEFDSQGDLIIHGVTNRVEMPVRIGRPDGNTLLISGTKALKMTDFRVQPPAPRIAGMPTIETGDDIIVTFDWVVRR